MPKIVYKLIFILIVAAFLAGITELFSLRFAKGDVYPAYSSLRADPLGTKVLFNSLGNFENLSVVRNYRSYDKLEGSSHSVLLYLGAARDEFQSQDKYFFQSLDQYVIQGGRLVISFLPSEHTEEQHVSAPAQKKEKKTDKPSDSEEDEMSRHLVSMDKHWGLEIKYQDSKLKKTDVLQAKQVLPALSSFLPQAPISLGWHSTAFFHPLNKSWHSLYTVNGKPVMVEEALGRGNIVFASDSFFFSNEALLKDRQVALLSSLLKGRTEIIFDEYHLGVISQHGVIDLMIKYRLHFFLLTLFVIFLLSVWKNAQRPIPGFGHEDASLIIESRKDYFEGLVSLLRKNIAGKDILKVCVGQWYQDIGHTSRPSLRGIQTDQEFKKFIDEVLLSVKNGKFGAAQGYQLIYQKLTQRRGVQRLDG